MLRIVKHGSRAIHSSASILTTGMLHFNAAGSSPPLESVLEVQVAHLRLESQVGGYEAARLAQDKLNQVYSSIAKLINADSSEIALLESATAAYNKAVGSIDLKAGQLVLCCAAEYSANVVCLQQRCDEVGGELQVIPSNHDGTISLTALEDALQSGKVGLVTLTHIPTNSGLVNPAEAVGALCAKYNAPYILDACQSAGQLPLNVEKIQCHYLSATGRKFLRGPRGTGFLYAKNGVGAPWSTPPLLDHFGAPLQDQKNATSKDDGLHMISSSRFGFTPRADAKRYEYWESSIASRLGLGAAVDHIIQEEGGMDILSRRYIAMGKRLRDELLPASSRNIRIRDPVAAKSAIVVFDAGENVDVTPILETLRDKHQTYITISTPQSTPFWGFTNPVLRASPCAFVTDEELVRFAKLVGETVDAHVSSL